VTNYLKKTAASASHTIKLETDSSSSIHDANSLKLEIDSRSVTNYLRQIGGDDVNHLKYMNSLHSPRNDLKTNADSP
jgi:hypothetical protein